MVCAFLLAPQLCYQHELDKKFCKENIIKKVSNCRNTVYVFGEKAVPSLLLSQCLVLAMHRLFTVWHWTQNTWPGLATGHFLLRSRRLWSASQYLLTQCADSRLNVWRASFLWNILTQKTCFKQNAPLVCGQADRYQIAAQIRIVYLLKMRRIKWKGVHNSSTEKKTRYAGAKMWNALPDVLKNTISCCLHNS